MGVGQYTMQALTKVLGCLSAFSGAPLTASHPAMAGSRRSRAARQRELMSLQTWAVHPGLLLEAWSSWPPAVRSRVVKLGAWADRELEVVLVGGDWLTGDVGDAGMPVRRGLLDNGPG